MDGLIDLIKKSGAVREFIDKDIPEKFIDKIFEAGRWSLSVHGAQPWKIIVIKNKKIIRGISNICREKSDKLFLGYRQILKFTAKTIEKSPIIFIILSDNYLSGRSKKFGKKYYEVVKNAEVQGVSAFIQNITLTINSMGLGSVWLQSPLFAENQIRKLLNFEGNLVSILCLGYPLKKIKRSVRKNYNDWVKQVK